MKKGCIAVFLVVVLVVIGVAVFFTLRADREFGLFESEQISHETVAKRDTRLRLVLRPEKLTALVLPLLPKKEELPWVVQNLPMEMAQLVPAVMPHEVAFLVKPDFRGERLELELFVNERRFGRMISEAVNHRDVFAEVPQVDWEPGGLTYEERGVLKARGSMAIPEGLEGVLLDHWTPNMAREGMKISEEEHLFEGVLDNRNGDLLTLIGAVGVAWGIPWGGVEQMLEQQDVLPYLARIEHVRVFADLVGRETLNVRVEIGSDAEYGPMFAPIINLFVYPSLKVQMKNPHGLALEGTSAWREAEGLVVGEYTVGNVGTFVESNLAKIEE